MSNESFESPDHIVDERMGLMAAYRWAHDPKTLVFVLARYKFVAKMLAGYDRVLEVGCADGFGSRIVRQAVGSLTAIDIDRQMIEDAKKNASKNFPIEFRCDRMDRLLARFDAVYALDVLEHVDPDEEQQFMEDFTALAPLGIIGMPSLESQQYASPFSAAHHVNCKTESGLRETMRQHYRHVFILGMNDEVVHTGFGPMCQYRFAIGIN